MDVELLNHIARTMYVDAADCYQLHSMVCHSRDPRKNGSSNRDAVWVVGWGRPKEACIKWGAHWNHLANTNEPPMCGGDAAFFVKLL